MPIDPTGKPILNTGASSGIGRTTALACARAGMPVALAARRADRLEEAASEVRRLGVDAITIPLDVTDAEACAAAVSACEERFGGLHAVFANAGYGFEEAAHETTPEAMRDIFEVNFFGTLNILNPAIPGMKERGGGHLLICSSCIARFPLPYYAAYSATKAAQHHVGRAMNLELRSHNIRVSTVHPVGTRTEFFDTAKRRSGDGSNDLVDHTPDALLQSPEKVARSVIRCIRRPRPEVWTSVFVRYGMGVAGVIPRIADFATSGMVRQRERRQRDRGGP